MAGRPEETKVKTVKFRAVVLALPMFVLGACGGGDDSKTNSANPTPNPTQNPTPTPTPSQSPTPTPTQSPTPTPSAQAGAAPKISGVISNGSTKVRVVFTRDMSDSAIDTANYAISLAASPRKAGNQLDVRAAEFTQGRTEVTLTTSFQRGVSYQLVAVGLSASDGAAFDGGSNGSSQAPAAFAGTQPSASSDFDLDGLPDLQEVEGWEVKVYRTGESEPVSTKHVFGDPEVPDGDMDGATDSQEYQKSDPANQDTDGDGLLDGVEITMLGTKPFHADSDEDGLADGVEVTMEFIDPPAGYVWSVEAGRGIQDNIPEGLVPYAHSNPNDPDTDGDGASDGVEAGLNTRDIRVAELPRLYADIRSISLTAISKNVLTTTTSKRQKDAHEVSSVLTSAEENSTLRTNGDTDTTVIDAGGSVTVGTSVGGVNPPSVDVSASASFNYSDSESSTTQFTQGSVDSSAESYGTARSIATETEKVISETREVTGGKVSAAVELSNVDDTVPLDVSNIVLEVYKKDGFGPDGSRLPIASLVLEAGSENVLQLPPNPDPKNLNTISRIFSVPKGGQVSADQIDDLLANPEGVVVEIGSATQSTKVPLGNGVEDTLAITGTDLGSRISNRTAVVTIDDGHGFVQTKRVATYNGLDAAGNLKPMPLWMVLERDFGLVRVPKKDNTGAPHEYSIVYYISSVANPYVDYNVPLLQMQFAQLGTVQTDYQYFSGFWTFLTAPRGPVLAPKESFEDIGLLAGDQVALVYVSDADGDGLTSREERLAGTSDNQADSDGDFLSDLEEFRSGWSVSPIGGLGRTVASAYSHGMRSDTDNDKLPDFFERACGLNPADIDTDGDGINDYLEIYGYTIDGVGDISPYLGQRSGLVDHDAIEYNDNGTERGCKNFPNGFGEAPAGYIAYASNPLNADTDKDGINDGAEKSLGINPNNGSDAATKTDEDKDGLFDSQEGSENKWTISVRADGRTSSVLVYSDPEVGKADTDNDGLPDLIEFHIKSNPRSGDTDSDGIPDAKELVWGGCVGMSQPNSNGDCQSSVNWSEVAAACAASSNCNGLFNPSLYTVANGHIGTSPSSDDTDADFLRDEAERTGYTLKVYDKSGSPENRKVSSSPIKRDTDGDGLDDFSELLAFGDPEKSDTDLDGVNDFEEANRRHPNQIGLRRVNMPDAVVSAVISKWNIGDDQCDAGDAEMSWKFGFIYEDQGGNESWEYLYEQPDSSPIDVEAGANIPLDSSETIETYPLVVAADKGPISFFATLREEDDSYDEVLSILYACEVDFSTISTTSINSSTPSCDLNSDKSQNIQRSESNTDGCMDDDSSTSYVRVLKLP